MYTINGLIYTALSDFDWRALSRPIISGWLMALLSEYLTVIEIISLMACRLTGDDCRLFSTSTLHKGWKNNGF